LSLFATCFVVSHDALVEVGLIRPTVLLSLTVVVDLWLEIVADYTITAAYMALPVAE
jgi:hypothetical protein